MRALRILGLALAVGAASLLASTPSMANCLGGGSIFQGFGGFGYTNCGDQPVAFVWHHQRAIQGVVSGATTNGAAGVDSGATGSLGDWLVPGALPGEYLVTYDWSQPGADGCTTLLLDGDLSCNGSGLNSLPVGDVALAGKNPTNPLHSLGAIASIDGNEPFQAWVLDQAGALSSDGDPCGVDASTNNTEPITCGSIPVPIIQSAGSCNSAGCTLQVQIPIHQTPVLDDCNVAMSKAITCPRNLYVGRQLFVKRAACGSTAPGAVNGFDTRTFANDVSTFPGTMVANFVPYSPEDRNLNGIVDGTETGPLTFVRITGNSGPATVPVVIPKIVGATDCVFLGIGLVYDSAPIAPGTNVFSPRVSVNGSPVSLDTATPAGDRVVNLQVAKKSGKTDISWDTTAELTTVGFNVIGTNRNGRDVQLNTRLIPAKHGTTGEGASYSISLTASALKSKGSTAVYIEIVKTNGAKERFGPASF